MTRPSAFAVSCFLELRYRERHDRFTPAERETILRESVRVGLQLVPEGAPYPSAVSWRATASVDLLTLAARFNDHPDYDPAWKLPVR